MKKKLLLISESMGGGLRKHVVQLIENLDQNEFEIYFIHGTETLDEAFTNDYEQLKEFATIIPCKSFGREINWKKDVAAYKFVSKKIKEIKPDIVHCHSSKAGVIGRLAAKKNGVKKVFYTPHAYSFLAPEFSNNKKKVFISIERFLSQHATTKTFAVSKGEKEAALSVKIDKADKIEVIYNGLPEIELPSKSKIRSQLNLPQDAIIIGNNARMSEQKNPMLFMEIAKEVIGEDNNYHFVWAGDGPLIKEVKKFITANGLTENIHLLGDRKDSELIVAGYDIFMITSLYEGLPYAPIEAMRADVPLIGTDVVGINEIITKSSGIFFPKSNTNKNESAKSLIDSLIAENLNVNNEFSNVFSLKKMIGSITNSYMEA